MSGLSWLKLRNIRMKTINKHTQFLKVQDNESPHFEQNDS